MPSETAPVSQSSELDEPTLPGVTPARITRAESAAESYRKLEPEILGLPEEKVGRVTTDVAQAASIALGALPNLLKFREDFKQFADADNLIKRLDMLQDYAMAAFYTHIRSLADANEQEVLQLLERGKPIREKLLGVAEALVGFALVDAPLVQSIRAGQGNLDTAQDLVALGTLFNANWELLEHKVPFPRALVREAGTIGGNLLHAIGITGIGEVRKDTSYDWLSLRARAFRLLVNEYEEIRRAVTYVRWHQGDANAFAPSLHSGTHKRRPSIPRTGDEPSEAPLPATDTPAPTPTARVLPGMPGESPFES